MKIPKKAQDLYNIAAKHIDNKEYKKALNFFKKALEIEPNYAEAMSKLGYVHSILNYKEMSKEEVYELSKRALNLNPKSPITWNYMGNTYRNKKEFNKAIECFEKVIELDPNYVKAWFNMGLTYGDKKEYNKEISYLEKAIELDPNYVKAWSIMGLTYRNKKEHNKAISYLEKAIELDSNDFVSLSCLGAIYIEKKEIDLALFYFKKIDPELIKKNYPENLEIVKEFSQFFQEMIKIPSEQEKKYQNFRLCQSYFRELAKNTNEEIFKKLSYIDLSNIKNILYDLKNHIHDFKNEVDKKNVKKLMELEAIAIIPWSMQGKIRRTILKLGVKYSRLQIAEIGEKCGEPEDCIIVVARDMIKNKEIYAEYFKSTKSLVFDQQANIDEIDNLMKKFEEWEKESRDKKL